MSSTSLPPDGVVFAPRQPWHNVLVGTSFGLISGWTWLSAAYTRASFRLVVRLLVLGIVIGLKWRMTAPFAGDGNRWVLFSETGNWIGGFILMLMLSQVVMQAAIRAPDFFRLANSSLRRFQIADVASLTCLAAFVMAWVKWLGSPNQIWAFWWVESIFAVALSFLASLVFKSRDAEGKLFWLFTLCQLLCAGVLYSGFVLADHEFLGQTPPPFLWRIYGQAMTGFMAAVLAFRFVSRWGCIAHVRRPAGSRNNPQDPSDHDQAYKAKIVRFPGR
ncbi:MAG: hypothetical protein AAF664_17805 [Planctomycetota bacterium]